MKSAVRTVEVLEFLASRYQQPARLREMSEALDVPKSSLYALLRTLVQRGWVRTDPTATLYGIGIRALMTGTSYLDADPYLRLVQPWLDEAKEQLNETIHFGRLDGSDIVYLATRESTNYLRLFSRVGRRLPALSTALGKSLLAAHPDSELTSRTPNPIPQLTPNTITDVAQLRNEMAKTRERGYSLDAEENTVGVRCFAFALRYTNPPVDAISCSVPVARLTPNQSDKILHTLSAIRERIEQSSPSVPGEHDSPLDIPLTPFPSAPIKDQE